MIRDLGAGDLDWLVEVTRRRRERLVPHAPRFWRPSADATARHRDFLASLVDDASTPAWRSEHGYLIATERDGTHVVDDAEVVAPGSWAVDGVALLLHLLARVERVRLVAPVHEAERLAAAEAVGMVPAEVWWHRDLPTAPAGAPPDGVTEVSAGRLVDAPPVYDPGGPVLLLHDVDEVAEREAAVLGATVAVVSQRPDDDRLGERLVSASYVRTTVFLESWVAWAAWTPTPCSP